MITRIFDSYYLLPDFVIGLVILTPVLIILFIIATVFLKVNDTITDLLFVMSILMIIITWGGVTSFESVINIDLRIDNNMAYESMAICNVGFTLGNGIYPRTPGDTDCERGVARYAKLNTEFLLSEEFWQTDLFIVSLERTYTTNELAAKLDELVATNEMITTVNEIVLSQMSADNIVFSESEHHSFMVEDESGIATFKSLREAFPMLPHGARTTTEIVTTDGEPKVTLTINTNTNSEAIRRIRRLLICNTTLGDYDLPHLESVNSYVLRFYLQNYEE